MLDDLSSYSFLLRTQALHKGVAYGRQRDVFPLPLLSTELSLDSADARVDGSLCLQFTNNLITALNVLYGV